MKQSVNPAKTGCEVGKPSREETLVAAAYTGGPQPRQCGHGRLFSGGGVVPAALVHQSAIVIKKANAANQRVVYKVIEDV
jgi:hypothetical protein